jgi:hypothetical protein
MKLVLQQLWQRKGSNGRQQEMVLGWVQMTLVSQQLWQRKGSNGRQLEMVLGWVLPQLEEKLENALQQMEGLQRKNKGLKEQYDTVPRLDGGAECLLLEDTILQNMKYEHECTALSGQ